MSNIDASKEVLKNHVLILQPTNVQEIHNTNNSGLIPGPVFQYVIKMFKIENNSVRPRRINRNPWNDSYNSKSNQILHFGDASHSEIPISIPESRSEQKPKTNKLKKFYHGLETYFTNSSLHGLRYVGDTSISFGERLFWLVSFFCAICFATYFINSIYVKYNLNPVIMSLNPTPTPVGILPFPAVTICNMNQAKKPEAEYILKHGTDVEKAMLDDFCNSNTSFTNSSNVSDDSTKWENVMKFMIRVNPSCQEILRVCMWRLQEMECSYLFNAALTDEGVCCTFNALPRNYIYRNAREMNDLNLTFPPDVDDWTPERGYSSNATPDTLPWKAAGAGSHLGLTITVDAAVSNYYCSSTSSVGFKVLLHNPIETPKMADFGFLIPPGVESRIVIYPKLYDATPSLRYIDYQKRMCFFTSERRLQFYRTYTERNCKLECQANYTLQLCNCVPYFLPKSKLVKICGKKDETCSNIAKEIMETPNENGTSCNCLPGCYELDFETTATFGKITEGLRPKENVIKNESTVYFRDNMAILHFFFIGTQFTRNTKSELYGFSEFLSNTGGLLGLFLGFSFLSAVEVVYYLSLRIFCNILRLKNKKSVRNTNANQALVYPFAK